MTREARMFSGVILITVPTIQYVNTVDVSC